MRYLTTFRVPAKVHDQIVQIISDVLANHREPPPTGSVPDNGGVPADPLESNLDGQESEVVEADRSVDRSAPPADVISEPGKRMEGIATVASRDYEARDVQNLEPLLQAQRAS